ncbi:MAG: AzlC family ABC transporter permease, partial [Ruminococcaceae bacterium]|nr:AzlC family ABC transporter permease [Oscillospiraceae bacterium]
MKHDIQYRKHRRAVFLKGLRDGIPIGLGYLAVSFSLGIAARNAGLTPFQSALASFLCNASAGEYAGFTVIEAGASFLEMALVTLIANARYVLMSCAMSQRISPQTRLRHRLLMSHYVTDELFGIAIARPGYLDPAYTYGAVLFAAPCWAGGTALGTLAGNLLPLRLVSAFSVALYGMFLAVIIPPARKSKVIAGLILFCFAASWAASALPVVSEISGGTRTIVLTVIISAAAALLFPRKPEEFSGGTESPT